MVISRTDSRPATDKQVRYLMYLLRSGGHMLRPFDALGVPVGFRHGDIEQWLRARSLREASALIDRLKGLRH